MKIRGYTRCIRITRPFSGVQGAAVRRQIRRCIVKDQKKTVLLGVTGGIAAYKAAAAASGLVKHGYDVHVLMTEHAREFITPLTFETLTGNRCANDLFDRNFEFKTEHISLAKMADLVLIAPATANIIAKLAHGIADDMLTTTVLACRCPKLIAPAMNTAMYENPVTQHNLKLLSDFGYTVIEPVCGLLACGDTGAGKLPEPGELIDHAEQILAHDKDMAGLRVLVTAGPTRETIDPVRFISNHSSGKMGYAIARAASRRGAEVTLVSGPVSLTPPRFVKTVPVKNAAEMFGSVSSLSQDMDIIVKAAAVADFRPSAPADEKIKKAGGTPVIELEKTQDILKWLGEHRREGQFLCGFSMETENVLENSRKKLGSKHVDMIVSNNLREKGAGFAGDTNHVTLITKDSCTELPMLTKEETADRIFDEILKRRR